MGSYDGTGRDGTGGWGFSTEDPEEREKNTKVKKIRKKEPPLTAEETRGKGVPSESAEVKLHKQLN